MDYRTHQLRGDRAIATLPTHIEHIQIAGPGINLGTNTTAFDKTWTTNRLCIVKFNARSAVGGLPTTGDDLNLSFNELRLYGVNTPDSFYLQSINSREYSFTTALENNQSLKQGQWLIDQDFPLWIRRIDYKTPNRISAFDVYYFD